MEGKSDSSEKKYLKHERSRPLTCLSSTSGRSGTLMSTSISGSGVGGEGERGGEGGVGGGFVRRLTMGGEGRRGGDWRKYITCL